MSIEAITDRIESEAKAYADDQRSRAQAEKNAALEEAKKAAEEVKAKRSAAAKTDSQVLKSRRQSVADLEVRKMMLAAKQEVIEESFAQALERLRNLPQDQYIRFLTTQLAPYQGEAGQVILNESDKAKHGAKLADALQGTSLTVADETAPIQGGCILKRGNISYNASLEKLLEDARSELTPQIAATLFAE